MAAAAVFAVIANASGGGRDGFVFSFGLICCIGGVICLLIAPMVGLIRNPQNKEGDKELAKAFLMAAGITFLVGTGVCSTLLIGLK